MQEIYYETVFNKKYTVVWLLSITLLPIVFSYFYFDGYYFDAGHMVPLVLMSIFLWFLWYRSKIQSKDIKFIINRDTLTKVMNGAEVHLSMKDINYLAIYRHEGKEPNTVDTTDDSGTVNFDESSLNSVVLLIKTNRGIQMTIKLVFIPFDKLRVLVGAILSSVESTKDAVLGYEILQTIYNSKNTGTVLDEATINSMSERNKDGVSNRRWLAILLFAMGTILVLGLFFISRWADSQL